VGGERLEAALTPRVRRARAAPLGSDTELLHDLRLSSGFRAETSARDNADDP